MRAAAQSQRLCVPVLLLCLVGVAGCDTEPSPPVTSESRTQTPAPTPSPDVTAERRTAITALLARRAQAVTTHDRAAFLATVDPQATAFLARQSLLYDALQAVPLASWAYDLSIAQTAPADDPQQAARYPGVTWWAPAVTLKYQLDGFDPEPVRSLQRPTFVQREGQWLLVADDDFAARGFASDRGIWDGGPVQVQRGTATMVLFHPGAARQAKQLATEVDAAIPRVTAAVGTDWPQRAVVLLPRDLPELSAVAGTKDENLTQIAALAVTGGAAVGGERVVVNPTVLATQGQTSRRVVMTHELVHVAMRKATTSSTPKWLSEGLADHVGFRGLNVPLATAVGDLTPEVRAGRVPATLPADDDFDGGNVKLGVAYGAARMAYEQIVTLRGEAGALEVYRAVGSGTPLETALGMSVAQFTAAWQAAMTKKLR